MRGKVRGKKALTAKQRAQLLVLTVKPLLQSILASLEAFEGSLRPRGRKKRRALRRAA